MLSLIPISLIASTTIGIAAVHRSEILKDWYEAKMDQTTENIKNQVIATRQVQKGKLLLKTTQELNKAKGVIAQAGSATAQDIKRNIQLHNGEYIRQIEQAKRELINGKGSEPFNQYVETQKAEISTGINAEILHYLSKKVEQTDNEIHQSNGFQ